jgi:hypothetical protein
MLTAVQWVLQNPETKSDQIRSYQIFAILSVIKVLSNSEHHLSNFQSARVRGGRTRKASALRNENPRRESDATRVDLTDPMDDTH